MKKYFRTEEHIYKRLFVDKAIINELGTGACDKDLNPIGETIVKQADTIEELIDVYICDKLMFLSKKQLSHYCYMPDKEIYGAIWVNGEHDEPILKSVAKLNDKGDLELL